MDKLIDLIGDERVSIASVEKNKWGANESLDKEAVKKSLEVKKKLNDTMHLLDDKSPEERIEWIDEQKSKADNLYKSKDFAQAMQVYLDALMGLNEQALGNATVKSYKMKICGNMAMCAVELNQTNKALELIKQAIMVDQDYYRNYLKQAIIFERAERFEKAK